MPGPYKFALPRNFEPGVTVQLDGHDAELNGLALTDDEFAITEEGYYELDVEFEEGEDSSITRFPICVVSPTIKLQSKQVTFIGDNINFRTMVEKLPASYAHGRVGPRFMTPEFIVELFVDRAAVIEIRAQLDNQTKKIGTILATGLGGWSSSPLALPRGLTRVKTALVYETTPFLVTSLAELTLAVGDTGDGTSFIPPPAS